MPDQPYVLEIFSTQRLRQNRNRCTARFNDHNFLANWIAEHLSERLSVIKKNFPLALQLGARGPVPHIKGLEKIITLDIADKLLPRTSCPVHASEECLPFAPHSFDLVFSMLSLHTVNDLPGTLIQVNRCLKPDGLFIGAIPGGKTLYELRQSLMQAEINLRGGAGQHIAPFADKQQIASLMQRARFALPVIDSETITVTYESIIKLMHDLRGMGENSSLREPARSLNKELLNETEKIYRAQFAEPDDRLPASFEIIFMIGWAPHESQQQPLKRGSAQRRLAEALGTEEISG